MTGEAKQHLPASLGHAKKDGRAGDSVLCTCPLPSAPWDFMSVPQTAAPGGRLFMVQSPS